MVPEKTLVCLLMAGLSPLLGAPAARVAIDAHTTILVDESEPGPIQKAVADLASDCKAVFGQPVRIVHNPAAASPSTIWIAFQHSLPPAVERPTGWEHLLIQTVRNPAPGSPVREALVLTGSDMRGTIYAIYQFSQEFLGIDPLYWWTDHIPRHQSRVDLPEFKETSGPRYHYRGWFINDEDLLTGWTPGIRDGTGISLETWDHVFEALLRLKGNMVVPGTWIFPYEPQIKAAGDRGLVITQHHVNVLGLDTYRWPKDKPYSFSSNPELLEAAWKRAMNEYPAGAEIISSVGYRGQNDYPFWMIDKDSPKTDEGRAHVIRSAIDKEIEIVRSKNPNAPIVMNAWREAAQFIREGFLKTPEGVTLVWPDNGHGLIEDGGRIGPGEGEYYHTAMYDYFSNHFTEMLPLERMQRELGRAVKAGATQFLLVNTSNIRPVVMTTRAVMELAWDPKPWQQQGAPDSYLGIWSQEEFGLAARDALVRYYDAYFVAPARYGSKEDAVMQDNYYQTAVRSILLQLIKGNTKSPARLGHLITHNYKNLDELSTAVVQECQAAEPRWQNVERLAAAARKLVPADRLNFFQANITTQVDVHLHSNRMLEAVAQVALSHSDEERKGHIKTALAEGEAVEAALEQADYGKWQHYYTAGDWLLDVSRTLALARAYQDKLNGRSVPENAVIRAQDGGFAYWMITAYQGTQTVQF